MYLVFLARPPSSSYTHQSSPYFTSVNKHSLLECQLHLIPHEENFPKINLIRKYIWCFQKCTFLSSGLLMTAVYIYWRHSLRWGRTHKLAFFMLSLLVFWRQWIHNGPLPSLQSQIHLLHKPRHCLRIIRNQSLFSRKK